MSAESVGTIAAIASLTQMAIVAIIAYLVLRIQRDGATLELRLADRMSKQLESFVHVQRFTDYSVNHAQEHAQLTLYIERELTRLRDFRHNLETISRGQEVKLDLQAGKLDAQHGSLELIHETIQRIKEELRELQENVNGTKA